MTPESMFHQMLGLGTDWQVTSCRFDPETGLVTLHLQETDQLWKSYRCPHDQGEAFCYDHTEELVWRHLSRCDSALAASGSESRTYARKRSQRMISTRDRRLDQKSRCELCS